MRLKPIVLCAVVAIPSFFGGTWIGKNAAKKPEAVPIAAETTKTIFSGDSAQMPTPTAANTPKPSPSSRPATYFLVLSDREICVYELPPEGDAVFVYAANVEIDQLRQEDYENLCRGIKVATLKEARALTEDFGS